MFDCSESGRLHAVSDLECTRWAQLGGYDRGDFCIHDGITGRDDANDECIVLTAGGKHPQTDDPRGCPACALILLLLLPLLLLLLLEQ